jgi:HD-GYP domain-containing protein (c-di-GMP phosphodiesterase class II)
LTQEEWHDIQRHSEVGYRILSSANEFSEIAEYVLSHQEHWDGHGYPKQLKGKEIPLQSRIIAVADAYDAMTAERTYCGIKSQDEAIDEIKKYTGTQFDPEVVTIFFEKVLHRLHNVEDPQENLFNFI